MPFPPVTLSFVQHLFKPDLNRAAELHKAISADALQRLWGEPTPDAPALLRQWTAAHGQLIALPPVEQDDLFQTPEQALAAFTLMRPLLESGNPHVAGPASKVIVDAVTAFPAILDGLRMELLEAGWIHPRLVYYFGATTAEQKAIAKRVDASQKLDMFDRSEADRLARRALAVAAGSEMASAVAKWASDADAKEDLLDPMTLRLAGRILTKNGKLRDLFFNDACRLHATAHPPRKNDVVVGPFDLEAACDDCGSPQFAVLAGKTSGPFAFLAKLGKKFAIPVCPVCIEERGKCSGNAAQTIANEPSAAPDTKRLIVGRAISPIRGAFGHGHYVGGLPRWMNDPEFPNCRECRKTMTFLACIETYQLGWGGSRTLAFVCEKCQVATVLAQQD